MTDRFEKMMFSAESGAEDSGEAVSSIEVVSEEWEMKMAANRLAKMHAAVRLVALGLEPSRVARMLGLEGDLLSERAA